MRGPQSKTIKFFLRGQKQSAAPGLKAFHNVIGNRIHELDYIAFAQHLAAELVQTLNFPPALMSFVCLFANARRKLASGNGRDQKREQGHPVLRVTDRKRSDRRQEEIV